MNRNQSPDRKGKDSRLPDWLRTLVLLLAGLLLAGAIGGLILVVLAALL